MPINREYISNAEARKLHREWAEWCERTGTLWSRLCEKAGYSTSIRGVVFHQNKGMLGQTRDDFQQAIAENPDGIRRPNDVRRDLLSEEDTAVLSGKVAAYLDRTGTSKERFSIAVGRESCGLDRLLINPTRISAASARRYERVMKNHPDGLPVEVEHKPSEAEMIEARRFEAERLRNERFARLNAEHQQRYGKPIGRAVWEMAA
ncbi:MAG: hypothetical protein CMG78_09500 [Marinobacter sp.]|nr:hypothetical protein [Marinobacter sp.]